MSARNRREFLTEVGRGMVAVTAGAGTAAGLGMAPAEAGESAAPLQFGALEPLVCLMQDTAAEQLLPVLVERLHRGTELRELVAAAALANARTFGGEDYIGFHTMMALSPAYHMAQELPAERRALPVLKVLYRNTTHIQAHGGRKSEVLHPVAEVADSSRGGSALREAVRRRDVAGAEGIFASTVRRSRTEAFNDLLVTVQDQLDVHRTVLPYRAWDLLDIIGPEHAHTMLRQSVRYCVKAEPGRNSPSNAPEALLPRLLEQYRLLDRSPGDRSADDSWVERLGQTLFRSTPAEAAEAAASALAEGFLPSAVGEAISLAANQLVLRDPGRRPAQEDTGKPVGSVHGDSVGVHACDTANAWRNMARVTNARNTFACLILGAYQVARDRTIYGADLATLEPLPVPYHLARLTSTEPGALLAEAEAAIRGNLQGRAAAAIHRYGQLGHPHRPVFDLLLRYAISEDGSLHAEKYYRTVAEEFAVTRPTFRWRQLVALARVTASEFGRPAPGYAEACRLLKV